MQEIFNKASTLHQQGQFKQAEHIYRQILEQAPGQPVVCARLALLLHQTSRAPEALSLYQVAIEGLPEEIEVLLQGVSVASQLGENTQAETWLKQILKLKPKHIQAYVQLAGVLIANHNEKEALETCKKLIKLAPKNANAYNLKGLALSRLGDTDKGYKAFQKSVKMNPGQIGVIRNLILYGKGRKEPLLEEIIPQLETSLTQGAQAPQVQMNIAYILSMFYERQKKVDKAFRYLKMGNDINRQAHPYEHKQTIAQFEAFKTAFDNEFVKAMEGKGLEDNSPIFILGMPRSGTTLIEQILSSHSKVGAEGEIVDLRESFTLHQDVLDDSIELDEKISACKAFAEEYIKRVRERRSSIHFTDKMPYNFILIGAILTAMPKAKVIHCTRDPLETCFSIYKQNFAGSHAYTNELTELGQYYKAYQDLMEYWLSLFGDRIYEANYESIVDDSESGIKALLSYCGLDEEEACFEFHKNKRAVRTASVAQVRQPIYKDAKKASSPYEKHLKPLIDELAAK